MNMGQALIIGFGNQDRGDDGVAYHVVNAVRTALGQAALPADETGLEALGAGKVESVFLLQLVPELLDVLAGYELIIFVDAHVQEGTDAVYCHAVSPRHVAAIFSHHLSPAMLLALLAALYGKEPAAYLVSIRGWDFSFCRGLSPASAALVPQACACILGLLSGGKKE